MSKKIIHPRIDKEIIEIKSKASIKWFIDFDEIMFRVVYPIIKLSFCWTSRFIRSKMFNEIIIR